MTSTLKQHLDRQEEVREAEEAQASRHLWDPTAGKPGDEVPILSPGRLAFGG